MHANAEVTVILHLQIFHADEKKIIAWLLRDYLGMQVEYFQSCGRNYLILKSQ